MQLPQWICSSRTWCTQCLNIVIEVVVRNKGHIGSDLTLPQEYMSTDSFHISVTLPTYPPCSYKHGYMCSISIQPSLICISKALVPNLFGIVTQKSLVTHTGLAWGIYCSIPFSIVANQTFWGTSKDHAKGIAVLSPYEQVGIHLLLFCHLGQS